MLLREKVESTGLKHVHWLISAILLILLVVEEMLVICPITLKIFNIHSAHSDKIVVHLLIHVNDIFRLIAFLMDIHWSKLLIPLLCSQIDVLCNTFVLSQTFA